MDEPNPWLEIPADDYLGHMAAPEVGQLSVLSELLRDALVHAKPARLLVPGCGPGIGFEHIDAGVTREVVGVDINPAYLARIEAALPEPPYARTLIAADLQQALLPEGTFDLVHVALLLEFLDWRALLPRIAGTVARGGCLNVVVQRASRIVQSRTPTPYTSLQRLDAIHHHVDPPELATTAAHHGLVLEAQRDVTLPRQKSFAVMRFRAR